ncbi:MULTISPECIES: low temperature requirement protein A [unclassified Amycolatopsis]|uniref:low temperature requirement protein A n=1 Tax=unclassified Amycolatopsis TaxID=2618356 RepID=UPI002875E6C1|nr:MULTISPECIES: low temperature requirement protein A [unclassified Amycolatopsis]MDS0137787.1 low temperature requirement protein A [Amycolatopsis sp. 505]MDS0144300.1 low temperature requirement protein A [Amycolatopsis sp. CM201R]
MTEQPSGTRVWYRPMRSRDRGEHHRVATPLELLFDLCFVVAVGQAAAALHHALAEGHAAHGVTSFAMVFFAIWWGWLNFSWFASAFDTDDVPYRLATLLQIAGGLTIAAGVSTAFEGDFRVIVAGYVLMRLAMVVQWLRAARSEPECRPAALRYAAGIAVVQVLWIARLWVPGTAGAVAFVVLVVAELAVPVWAESRGGTTWHPHHIAERYGLFTLIVLGETILSATNAIKEGTAEPGHIGALVSLAAAGLVLVFSMWWLYFDRPGHARLVRRPGMFTSMSWGYGHYFIFASAAAVGAGLEVAVAYDTGALHLAGVAAALPTTVPVAVFLLSVWLLHIGPTNECRPIAIGFPATAALVLAASFTPAPIHVAAVLTAALVVLTVVATHGSQRPA